MTELEKEYEKQFGFGKTKVGLIVCAVLVVILAISSVWFYNRIISQQNQIDNLNSEKNSLQSQVDVLTANNTDLQNQVDTLTEENWDLWTDKWLLETPDLYRVDFIWYDLYPEPYVNLIGSVFNAGNQTATNVLVTVFIYDAHDVLINDVGFPLGNIAGRTYQTFDFDIECFDAPTRVTTTIEWD